MSIEEVFTTRKIAPADVEEHSNGYRLQWHADYDVNDLEFQDMYEDEFAISEENIAYLDDGVAIRQFPCEPRSYRAHWGDDGTVTLTVYEDLLEDEDELETVVAEHGKMVTRYAQKKLAV